MKNKLFAIAAMLCVSLSSSAQVQVVEDLDLGKVDTLDNVFKTTGRHVVNNNDEETKRRSWKRKTFFRLNYNKTDLNAQTKDMPAQFMDDGKNLMLDGQNNGKGEYEYKSKLAMSLQWGRNISLHKKAIGNMVKIALDYTWIDLNFNQFDSKYSSTNKFVASKFTVDDGDFHSSYREYAPWGTKKNEINYGMTLGPSITLAPLGFMNNKHAMGLHLQAYYHIGYTASVLMGSKNDDADVNDGFMAWGHGLTKSWGVNLSYKAIGFGMEKRSFGTIKYKYMQQTEDYGEDKFPFNMENTRFYVTFNF